MPLINCQLNEHLTWKYRSWKWFYIRYIVCTDVILNIGNQDYGLTDVLQCWSEDKWEHGIAPGTVWLQSFHLVNGSTYSSTRETPSSRNLENYHYFLTFPLFPQPIHQPFWGMDYISKLYLESTHFTPGLISHCNSLFPILWASISTQ